MDYESKRPLNRLGMYLDMIEEARLHKWRETLLALYDELIEIGRDFSVPMERKDGAAYIYKDMDVMEAVCRLIGPDEAMLDMCPELGCVACEGDAGWHQTRSFREVFTMAGGRDE